MNGNTKLVGLIGWPLSYTLSPAMHNRGYEALKLNYAYIPLRVDPNSIDSLRHAVSGLRAFGFTGANVTIPYKQLIIPYVDNLSTASLKANSVNTIILDDEGYLRGDTTDGSGFMLDLKHHGIESVKDLSVAIVGAGGCAYAIVLSLLEHGCANIFIYNRGINNAQDLASKANNIKANSAHVIKLENIKKYDLVINCTPPNVINNLVFSDHQIIYDTNYMHDALNFKIAAEKSGARFISGIGMLLYSGSLSFEQFTRVKAPIDVMKNAL